MRYTLTITRNKVAVVALVLFAVEITNNESESDTAKTLNWTDLNLIVSLNRTSCYLNTSTFAAHLSVLAVLRNSRTVIGFFWMLYWVKSPDWPVTTCWIGAGITRSSMSSYVRRGFQSFGGTTCNKQTQLQTSHLQHEKVSHSVLSWMKILLSTSTKSG